MIDRSFSSLNTLMIGGVVTAAALLGQTTQTGNAPIYHVTVIERTTKAINYRYRSDPTLIDFAGTVLMPKSKGSAIVTSKQGRTEIDASFEHLSPPTPLGREFLTYVLWALTPDGRPHNLGEVIANSQDRASLRVSTDLQAFALIVTAEPYSAIRTPSDAVVLENQVRPETVGIIEQVNARYELLPRGHYTLTLSSGERPPESARVSTREYEVLLELYQAQNAINIARTARADTAAGDVLARAEALLSDAQRIHNQKGDRTLILQKAREATQTAEDARLVAEERSRREKSESLKAEVSLNRQKQANAEAEAAKARVERQAVEEQLQRTEAELRATQSKAAAQLEAERTARVQAEADLRTLQLRKDSGAQATAANLALQQQRKEQQKALRVRVLESLNSTIPTRDTPRGLVVTIVDSSFAGAHLQPETMQKARRLAEALAGYHGLTVAVEGHSDTIATERESVERAEEVATVLRTSGVQASAQGIGNRRPLGPGGPANSRVEIVVSGDALGDLASWDRTYSLSREDEVRGSGHPR